MAGGLTCSTRSSGILFLMGDVLDLWLIDKILLDLGCMNPLQSWNQLKQFLTDATYYDCAISCVIMLDHCPRRSSLQNSLKWFRKLSTSQTNWLFWKYVRRFTCTPRICFLICRRFPIGLSAVSFGWSRWWWRYWSWRSQRFHDGHNDDDDDVRVTWGIPH